jgi:Dna[CI] antecedent, DciA
MERIGGAIRRELGRFGPVDVDMVEIVRAWPEAVGETVARNAWPARLARDGTLHVNAASSTWAFELGRLGEAILEQLRAKVGDAAPPALKFVPGPLPEPAPPVVDEDDATPFHVGADERLEGAALAAAIEDDELRELVARAAAASLARARSDRSF